MFKSLMVWLKEKGGFHHGLILTVISWIGFLIFPLLGIYLAVRMDGWYSGREEKEAELRGFRPLDRSTWKMDQFEWWDFITPFILSIINIALMVWLADWSFLIIIIEGS